VCKIHTLPISIPALAVSLLEVIAVPKWNSVLQQVSWLFPKKIDKLFQSRKLNKHEDCFKPVSSKKTINLSSHISFGNSLSVPERNILNFICHFMAVSMTVPRKQANIYGTGK
jgi:hypothetical protein